jgi:hypothetical protein
MSFFVNLFYCDHMLADISYWPFEACSGPSYHCRIKQMLIHSTFISSIFHSESKRVYPWHAKYPSITDKLLLLISSKDCSQYPPVKSSYFALLEEIIPKDLAVLLSNLLLLMMEAIHIILRDPFFVFMGCNLIEKFVHIDLKNHGLAIYSSLLYYDEIIIIDNNSLVEEGGSAFSCKTKAFQHCDEMNFVDCIICFVTLQVFHKIGLFKVLQ